MGLYNYIQEKIHKVKQRLGKDNVKTSMVEVNVVDIFYKRGDKNGVCIVMFNYYGMKYYIASQRYHPSEEVGKNIRLCKKDYYDRGEHVLTNFFEV